MTAAACTVQDGAGAPQTTTNGATVTAGNVVTIQLADLSANTWSITLAGQDDLIAPPALTIDSVNKKATFTAPAAPWSLIYQSQVNAGKDINNVKQPTWTTTLKISCVGAAGAKLMASNERNEGSALFGWITIFNALIRGIFGLLSTSQATSSIDYLQTTNATPTVFATSQFACPDNTLIDVIVTVVGKKVSSADRFCQDYRARYYRNGGALTLDGSVIAGGNSIATGTIAAAVATLVLSSNTVQIQVTGIAATSINWSATMQVQQCQ